MRLPKNIAFDTSGIVRAILDYAEPSNLESNISSLTADKSRLKESIESLESKYAHLGTLSKSSEAFLEKFNYNLHDIELIHRIATRYGDPSTFSEHLDGYLQS